MNFSAILKSEIQQFITQNIGVDISKLALQKNPFPEDDWQYILNQISSKTKAKTKLPTWFNNDNIVGTAIIIPVIPKRNPQIKVIRKISNGWEFKLLEKINGCERLLSIIWTIQNPIKTYKVVGKISVWKSLPKWLIMVKAPAKTDPISGPTYGIMFKMAHKKAIIKAFSIPKIKRTIK